MVTPRVRGTYHPVVYCHSAGMTGAEAWGVGQLPSVRELVASLVSQGCVVAATSLAVNFGNATSQSRITDAIDWLQSSGWCDPGEPVTLIGASMGANASLVYASLVPENVACVVGMIPLVDTEAVREANTAGLRTYIDTAWGVTYPEPLPSQANPADPANAMDVPVQLWYANNDAISVNIADYAAAIDADAHDVGALDHTDAAVAAVDAQDILSFMRSAVADI